VSAIGGQLFRDGLHHLLGLYAIVVMTHFALQVTFAHKAYRAAVRSREQRGPLGRLPSVDVIVTSYNEEPDRLDACLQSIVDQDYPGEVSVYVVDDYSANRDELMPVYRRFAALPRWQVILAKENRGKRAGQDAAFRRGEGELIVTVDSDTEVDADGVTEIVRAFEDERIGAATGDVGVTNHRQNILTRLIGMRYWVAFNQERAAQGYFRSVLCCSGPLAAYRRSVLDQVWERYVTQSYRGITCTYGDDRHLTNLVLAVGYDTTFIPFAHAITYAPEDLGSYLRQQLRWNKSFYRELLWTMPFMLRCSPYVVFEVLVQTVLPLLLTLALVTALVLGAVEDPARLWHYAFVIVAMAVLRCSYAIYRTKRLSFLLFVLYGFLHVALLIPTRMRALVTLGDNSWGTRTAVQRSSG
jgi:hyaluronan synthase/N-acetylglucosaminyltransferase